MSSRVRRLRAFWRPNVDADVDDELRHHLDACAADLAARGMSPAEARRVARERFGDVDRVRDWLRAHDRHRQRREDRVEIMETLWQDVRYAARKLWQQPGFTAAVVVVLALGIGATTAMFSAIDAALLRPFPFQRDDRLVQLRHVDIPTREFSQVGKGGVEIADARALTRVFTHVGAYAPGGLDLTGAGDPLRVKVTLVTRDLFATLGVAPALGRGFTAEESATDGPRAAILSDALWRRQFGGDANVIGRDVRLNDVPHRVVGVMPRGLAFPSETELYLPLTEPMSLARWEPFRQYMPSLVVARLAPGVSPRMAGERMRAIFLPSLPAELRAEPDFRADSLARPLRDVLVGGRRSALLILFGATAMVLLVACANAANLLLARAAARRGEVALRAALGATRARLVRQLLVESTLLALAGAALGVVLAYVSLGALSTLLPPSLSGMAAPRIDVRVLGFTFALALVTGVAFGLWPAFGAARADAGETVKTAATSGAAAREGVRTRRVFVVAELALALMLAVGAGLMLRSFRSMLAIDLGVRAEHVATLELSLPNARYGTPAASRRFLTEVLERISATLGVEAAGFVNNLPMSGAGGIALRVRPVGTAPADAERLPFAANLVVSPDYFRAAGIRVLRGRTFAADVDSTRRAEIVINERMARAYWPGENPVGKLVDAISDTQVVVGVVADVRSSVLEEEPKPQMYASILAHPMSKVALVARGSLPVDQLGLRLRDAVASVDRSQAVYNVRSLSEVVGAALAPRRTNTLLITLFGVVALTLAAVGVYGVIAHAVARRAREIGIRVALGARRGDVVRLVLAEGVPLALLGVALGLAGAWALRTFIASLLYGVTPADPVTFAGAAALLLLVALVATVWPAREAMRVDPVRAIKAD